MAKSKTTAAAYPLIIAAIFAAATAQFASGPAPALSVSPVAPGPYMAGAPSPGGVDCFTYIIKLSDCLTFVEGGSNLKKPDKGCCPELANLVNTQPVCLCELLGNPGQTGISVDVKRALKLPSVCNVETPPVSLCAAIGVPVGDLAPSATPFGAPLSGGAAVPSAGGNSGSPSNLASNHSFLIGFAFLFFTYLF